MMKRSTKVSLLVAGLAAVAVASYSIGRARAGGVPAAPSMTYSGFLEDEKGPVSGMHSIGLELWDDPTSDVVKDHQKCATSSKPVSVDKGMFHVVLDPGCDDAVKASSNLYVQVVVDGTQLERTRITAIPYALQAGGVDWAGVANVPAEWPGRVERPAGAPAKLAIKGTNATSLDGLFCKETAEMVPTVGLVGAKDACETACGSQTAHVCTAQEMRRTVEVYGKGQGSNPKGGWLYSGHAPYVDAETNLKVADCVQFLQGSSAFGGTVWTGSGTVGSASCSEARPFYCCD